MATDSVRKHQLEAMQATIASVFGDATEAYDGYGERKHDPACHGVHNMFFHGQLRRLVARIRAMQKAEDKKKPVSMGACEPFDQIRSAEHSLIDTDGLSPEQEAVVRHVISGVECTTEKAKQTLTMLHGGAGTGKSFIVRRMCTEIEKRGRRVVSTCPTGAGACQLIDGQTFHSAFKCRKNKDLSPHQVELLKTTFDRRVALVVVDEASMLSCELLVLLDERLRMLYDKSKPFGGISILLVGDFFQLKVVKGTPLCKAMYQNADDKPKVKIAKGLFRQFKIMFLRRQERARDCERQQELLSAMRALPDHYPTSTNWIKKKRNPYRPITPDVVRVLTTPLTSDDVARDPRWIDSSVVLVTSNGDRAAMNASMSRILSSRRRVLLFRWRKRLTKKASEQLGIAESLLYNEQERPTLFGYFFKGAPGQILDNANRNVLRGIANGTRCRYHSLGWDDDEKTRTVLDLTRSAIQRSEALIDLPFAPDFINVALLNRDGEPVSSESWPSSANLESTVGSQSVNEQVIVPIGTVASKSESYFVKLPKHDLEIHYIQHAVDLAMAMTIWKAQGTTFDRVILHLEVSSGSPSWKFEHLYVALSRVRSIQHIRCLPLSLLYKKKELEFRRPDINTVEWQLDLDDNGVWKPR